MRRRVGLRDNKCAFAKRHLAAWQAIVRVKQLDSRRASTLDLGLTSSLTAEPADFPFRFLPFP
jgi:hypothetical protein